MLDLLLLRIYMPFNHVYLLPYLSCRVWRVFSLANPAWGATEDGECSDSWCTQYPFSVPVEKPMDARDIIKILRDHYEGTTYDLTKGIAAGPYGNPNRYGK